MHTFVTFIIFKVAKYNFCLVSLYCSVAEAEACKMPVSNLARIFGPTIIGYSCPEPDPEMALKQLKKQHSVGEFIVFQTHSILFNEVSFFIVIKTMEKLLQIPSDYWTRYVDAETETYTSTPVSSRHPGVATIAK